jgi:hypothetical protein
MVMGLGKALIHLGVVFVVVGLVLVVGLKIPFLGKLPGDLHSKKGDFELHIPLATSVVLSLVVSGILRVIRRVGRI